jgi:chemotaxis response regulator CheB
MTRVLIIDESPITRELIASHLARFPGVTVVGMAVDVAQALAMFELLQPDVMTLRNGTFTIDSLLEEADHLDRGVHPAAIHEAVPRALGWYDIRRRLYHAVPAVTAARDGATAPTAHTVRARMAAAPPERRSQDCLW